MNITGETFEPERVWCVYVGAYAEIELFVVTHSFDNIEEAVELALDWLAEHRPGVFSPILTEEDEVDMVVVWPTTYPQFDTMVGIPACEFYIEECNHGPTKALVLTKYQGDLIMTYSGDDYHE